MRAVASSEAGGAAGLAQEVDAAKSGEAAAQAQAARVETARDIAAAELSTAFAELRATEDATVELREAAADAAAAAAVARAGLAVAHEEIRAVAASEAGGAAVLAKEVNAAKSGEAAAQAQAARVEAARDIAAAELSTAFAELRATEQTTVELREDIKRKSAQYEADHGLLRLAETKAVERLETAAREEDDAARAACQKHQAHADAEKALAERHGRTTEEQSATCAELDTRLREASVAKDVLHGELAKAERELSLLRVKTDEGVAELEERLRRSEEEVAASGQRIEELERVKEDVNNQVEKARQDTVKDNCELYKRTRELEGGIESLQRDRDAAATRADGERRAIEKELLKATSRAQAAELNLTEAESHLNEVRVEALDEANALRCEHAAALARRIADFEMEREAERTARDREHDEFVSRRSQDRWQLLVQAVVAQQTAAQFQEQWTHARRALGRRNQRTHREEADAAQLQRLKQEVARQDNENEALVAQNQELLRSLEQAHHERVITQAETERLLELEKTYEKDFLKISETNAELGGHANHKQKIKHLMQIKEDNFKLRENAKIMQMHLMQTQAQLRSEKLVDHFTSPSHGHGGTTATKTPLAIAKVAQAPPSSAGRGALCQDLASSFEKCGSGSDDRPEALRGECAEAARQVRLDQRAADKTMVEYQHLLMLVHQVFRAKPNGEEGSRRGVEELTAGTEEIIAGNPSALLQHLRELAGVQQQTSTQHGCVTTTPSRNSLYRDTVTPLRATSGQSRSSRHAITRSAPPRSK
jgi:hypothetical protein